MKFQKNISKLAVVALICLFGSIFIFSNTVYAGQFYPGGQQRCLANSGGRQEFLSIQYACRKAEEKNQNACASWLGPSGNSATRHIRLYATKGMTQVALSLYGMCTDKPDTSSTMVVGSATTGIGDAGFITGQGNFTRSAPWGNVSTRTVYLNVEKFKASAASVTVSGNTKIYYNVLYIFRGHSTADSWDHELAWVWLYESEAEKPVTNLCQAWMPSSYPASNANSGTTTIVVKARNTAGRFGGAMSGSWHHDNPEGNSPAGEIGPIYAMPTDVIQWHSC